MTKGRIINSENGRITLSQVGVIVVGIVLLILLVQITFPLIVAILIWSLAGWGAGKIVQGKGYDPITNVIYVMCWREW